MRYLIDGCYGDGNVGDEALLQAVCQLIGRHDRGAAIRVLTADPPQTERLHGLPSLLQANPLGSGFYGAVIKGQLLRILRAIRWSDCFVLGGGELFRDDVGPRAVFGMFHRFLLAALLGRRTIAISVGAQPPSSRFGAFVLGVSMRRAGALVFRDDESAEVARRLGVRPASSRVCSDVVLTEVSRFAQAAEADPWSGIDPGLKVCVSLKSLPRGHPFTALCGEAALVRHVADALLRLHQERAVRVTALAFATGDVVLSEALSAALQGSGIHVTSEQSLRTDRLASWTHHADMVVAMPLHASVFAFGLGVPAVGIGYDHKVRKLYGRFGLDAFCLAPGQFDGDALGRACVALLDARPSIRRSLESGLREEALKIERIAADLFRPPASPNVVARLP